MGILDSVDNPAVLRSLPKEDLPKVCAELREKIISGISKTGGHLGSSLGAVDLITSLHYVFNTPEDKIVFDTGHQAYAHKLLTGRAARFSSIRKKGGISGFLRRDESEYDAFGAGHASTALSAALGMAAARDYQKKDYKVVAVVSDGCMTGGMAYEALQNAGNMATDILVVLNDNQMFISNRVGALGAFLTRALAKASLQNAEKKVGRFLKKFDFWGNTIIRIVKRTKVLFFPGMLFEEMGFSYLGPVDGHDTNKLVESLRQAKELSGPVVLHVMTKKGKGYAPAEESPIEYHGLGIFDKVTGEPSAAKSEIPSFTKIFSKTLVRLAQEDSRIVAITAAMPEGTGLDAFRDKFPRRYYDVGIAEEHAVTFAAGLACQGLKPVVAIYSSFAQRAYDQILHDVCLQKLPVVFALDRAGVVGEDGPTHHGLFDMSFLRTVPNLVILAPSDENELQHALKTAFECGLPCVVRYPRGAGFGAALDSSPAALPLGKSRLLKPGKDLVIFAAGNRVSVALLAAQDLAAKGIDAGVVDARFIKPLDSQAVQDAAWFSGRIVTVEDNVLAGGFGSAVAECLADGGIQVPLLRLGAGDGFVEHGTPAELYDICGVSREMIVKRILEWFNR